MKEVRQVGLECLAWSTTKNVLIANLHSFGTGGGAGLPPGTGGAPPS